MTIRPRTALASLSAMGVLLLGGMLMPVPYAVESPGPAVDVLGEFDGKDIVSVEDERTYPVTGSLMLTTVSVNGGPGYPVNGVEVLRAWVDPTRKVLPREAVFPEGQTKDQTALINSVDMSTSQQTAVAVALRELGREVPAVVVVAGVEEGAPAEGVLRPGDQVLAINGTASTEVQALRDASAGTPEGRPVEVRVRRDGTETTVRVPTRMVDGTPRMGVVLAPGYDLPVDVRIAVGDIGGPSAGTIFALGVYDELTPGPLTGGREIAGTGTIDDAGKVGAIGGIRQKMIGAREEGAEFFLAPAANCDEVLGHVPDGLTVVRVQTFDEALGAVTEIGRSGSAAGLPTCQ
ncbi:PDZ domain-containing protein [Brachybacterium sp. EF45031]|uniref:YlbL family protein n=1 Tax=Brachybacterium sillae TaxID=2810536 RepID=UPI00217CEDE7|nr:PDZ domain-containing protein [Brachybacterium sillae]MCS6712494.1 PDZ domain-containing protein [Brachybacterium sillae]